MILESVIHCQLYEYLDSNYLLLNMQFGLRSKRSTATALSGFTDEVLLNMEKGNICSAVFLDLSEAFDAVDCEILMSKLSSVGVSPGLWSGFLRIWVIGISKPPVIVNYSKPFPLLSGFHKEASWDPYFSLCMSTSYLLLFNTLRYHCTLTIRFFTASQKNPASWRASRTQISTT